MDLNQLVSSERIPSDPDSIDRVRARLFGPPQRTAPSRYELRGELGEGAFGVVHRAFDRELSRSVALKIIRYHTDVEKARIRREAETLAQLSHPNVVQVYDQGPVDDGVYFIALEHVQGMRLDAWLGHETRSLPQILDAFLQTAEGLHAIHQQGLVHRDFKPANVVVGDDGRVRVLDFGLAKRISRPDDETQTLGEAPESMLPTDHGRSFRPDPPAVDDRCARDEEAPTVSDRSCSALRSGGHMLGNAGPQRCSEAQLDAPLSEAYQFVGTLGYAAPEQGDRARPVDARSDLFSFCVTLFEAVYGFRPFLGSSHTQITTRMAVGEITDDTPERRVPRWLRALLRRGLSPMAEDRPADLAEVIAILRKKTRSSRPQVVAATVAAIATAAVLVLVFQLLTRGLDEEWDHGWTEQRDQLARDFGEGLVTQLEAYEQSWLDVGRTVNPWVEDSTVVDCMRRGQSEFLRLVDALGQGKDADVVPAMYGSMRHDRLLIARVLAPDRCARQVGGSHHERDGEAIEVLLESQRHQLVGEYREALADADAARRLLPWSPSRLSGAIDLQRGLLQLQLDDPAAGATLDRAVLASEGDAEFLVEALTLRLLAGLYADEPLDRLSRQLAIASAPIEGPHHVMNGWIEYSEGQRLLDDDPAEAERRFRIARGHFRADGSDRGDLRVINCELHLAYAQSRQASKAVQAAELGFDALTRLVDALGHAHPYVTRHQINVALVLQLAERESASPQQARRYRDSARRLLARAQAADTSDPQVAFEVVRATAGTLFLDLENAQNAGTQDEQGPALFQRSVDLENALEPHLERARRDDIGRVVQTIAQTRWVTLTPETRTATLEALRWWLNYEGPLRDKVQGYIRMVEEQKSSSADPDVK